MDNIKKKTTTTTKKKPLESAQNYNITSINVNTWILLYSNSEAYSVPQVSPS